MLVYFIMMSIALSIDALGIGISYRLKGVLIPLRTKIIVGITTTVIMYVALTVGTVFHDGLPGQFPNLLGAMILIVIGLVFLRNSLGPEEKVAYDFNDSRTIEPIEGLFLAIALSADSFGAGIAVASTGIRSYVLACMVGGMQLFFLFLAECLVEHVPYVQQMSRKLCGYISGSLLLIIGLLRLFMG